MIATRPTRRSAQPDDPAGERDQRPALCGRRMERGALDGLLEGMREGSGGALVVRGDAGIGKTALLEYLVARSSGCRVTRTVGQQSEMELPFAALHQLCRTMLDGLEELPGPQRDALRVAFGLAAGEAPDRLLVGLGAVRLLSSAGRERPLVCVVDDAHWVDRSSAQALAFVARRVSPESVAVVLAVREPRDELAGLPELVVEGLSDADGRALLGAVIRGPLDERVRDRMVVEAGGNPLTLLETPLGVTYGELAGGFGLWNPRTLAGPSEESLVGRVAQLPERTRRLLEVAAAEPVGDTALLSRAAGRLGIGLEAAGPAVRAGLLQVIGERLWFSHPSVRMAVHEATSEQDRRRAQGALADATDRETDPDCRAWHRAQATSTSAEDIALELESSAGRAQARGGVAAAAAFLERAAGLTPDPARRAQRALAAARAKHQVAESDAALGLLAMAEPGPLDEAQRALVSLTRAQVAFTSARGGDAARLLLTAAAQLAPLDPIFAREGYRDALAAAMFDGHVADLVGLHEVAEAVAARAPVRPERASDLLLDGLAMLVTEGHSAGTAVLKGAMGAFRAEDRSREEELGWLWLACHAAQVLWEDDTLDELSARQVELAREAGAFSVLPIALDCQIGVRLFAGELAEAAALVDEVEAVSMATGGGVRPYGAVMLAGWQGREDEALALGEACSHDVLERGEGLWLSVSQWAGAVLYNGLSRFEDALDAAVEASASPAHGGVSGWALVELVEAAARTRNGVQGARALERFCDMTRASGTEWARGLEARSRALLSEGEVAEEHYRDAIDRLGRSRAAAYLARTHLVYGEWLRRNRRRPEAREQLGAAHEMLTEMGLDAFAARAARELFATGEKVRGCGAETRDQLTEREAQIARLARDGLSNPEIGARLFLSARTVEYHLSKVYSKMDIGGRHELDRALSCVDQAGREAA
jgi:DNA-binding CsgD family transcriptional regulator